MCGLIAQATWYVHAEDGSWAVASQWGVLATKRIMTCVPASRGPALRLHQFRAMLEHLHRELAAKNRNRLAPRFPGASWAEELGDEYALRLFEGEVLEIERAEIASVRRLRRRTSMGFWRGSRSSRRRARVSMTRCFLGSSARLTSIR